MKEKEMVEFAEYIIANTSEYTLDNKHRYHNIGEVKLRTIPEIFQFFREQRGEKG